jgi:hypothetical protein
MESRAYQALIFVFLAGCVVAGLSYFIGISIQEDIKKQETEFKKNYACPTGHIPMKYRGNDYFCVVGPIKKD